MRRPGHALYLRCLGVAETANTAALFARAETLGVWHVLDEEMTQAELPVLLAGLDALSPAAITSTSP